MRKAEEKSVLTKRKERQNRIKHWSKHREENTDIQWSGVQLHPFRGKCYHKSKGKVIMASLAKTFDTKDISLVNFTLE